MKRTKRIWAALCCLMLLLPSLALGDTDGFSTSYTYTYDYWEDVQASPDAYRVATVIDSMTLGLENLENIRISKAQSLYARDNLLYIADSTNNRILELERKGNTFTLKRLIKEMTGAAAGSEE